MAVEAERRLRKLARASGADAFLVRLNARVASRLAGPGGAKLIELEDETGKRFSLEPVERLPLEEVDVVADGARAEIAGESHPVKEGQELKLRIAEPHMYNLTDGTGHVDAYPVVVGGAIGYVGTQQKVRIDRVSRHTAYASLVDSPATAATLPPIGGEGEWELPEPEREVGERLELDERRKSRTRKPAARKPAKAASADEAQEQAEADAGEEAAPKPKARRSRAKKPAGEPAADAAPAGEAEAAPAEGGGADGEAEPAPKRRRSRGGRGRTKTASVDGDAAAEPVEPIGEPAPETAADGAGEAESDGDGAASTRRRRGRRGGRGRGRAATAAADGEVVSEPPTDVPPIAVPAATAELPAGPAPVADAEPPKPRPRRRRTTAAPAAADGAGDGEAPPPTPVPPAEPDAGDARRGLLGKLLGT